jgi:hypothetical protein
MVNFWNHSRPLPTQIWSKFEQTGANGSKRDFETASKFMEQTGGKNWQLPHICPTFALSNIRGPGWVISGRKRGNEETRKRGAKGGQFGSTWLTVFVNISYRFGIRYTRGKTIGIGRSRYLERKPGWSKRGAIREHLADGVRKYSNSIPYPVHVVARLSEMNGQDIHRRSTTDQSGQWCLVIMSALRLTVNFIMADNKIYFRNMFSRCFCGAAKLYKNEFWFLETFKEHSANIQETFSEHSVNIQCTFREHTGNIQGTFGQLGPLQSNCAHSRFTHTDIERTS